MKYFAVSFIVGVFLTMYVVNPIMNAIEAPGLAELLGLLFANHLLLIIFCAMIIFIIFFWVYKSVKKSKYV